MNFVLYYLRTGWIEWIEKKIGTSMPKSNVAQNSPQYAAGKVGAEGL